MAYKVTLKLIQRNTFGWQYPYDGSDCYKLLLIVDVTLTLLPHDDDIWSPPDGERARNIGMSMDPGSSG